MEPDLVLDDNKNWITMNAGALNLAGSDFMLDSSARRGGKPGSFRRALVHDSGDCLSINFGGDYSGGVNIRDARVNLRITHQSGQPTLPAKGRPGDLIAIASTTKMDGVPVGESVTLWICVGTPVQALSTSTNVYWAPISMGKAVQGTQ